MKRPHCVYAFPPFRPHKGDTVSRLPRRVDRAALSFSGNHRFQVPGVTHVRTRETENGDSMMEPLIRERCFEESSLEGMSRK